MAWALAAALEGLVEADTQQVKPCPGVACAVEAAGSCGCSLAVGRMEWVEEDWEEDKMQVVVGLEEGHLEAGKHVGGKALRKRVANGGRMVRLSSSRTAGFDSPHSTCTSWLWTCPLCSWRVAGVADGEAEGAELHGVEVGPLVSLNQQRLLALLL